VHARHGGACSSCCCAVSTAHLPSSSRPLLRDSRDPRTLQFDSARPPIDSRECAHHRHTPRTRVSSIHVHVRHGSASGGEMSSPRPRKLLTSITPRACAWRALSPQVGRRRRVSTSERHCACEYPLPTTPTISPKLHLTTDGTGRWSHLWHMHAAGATQATHHAHTPILCPPHGSILLQRPARQNGITSSSLRDVAELEACAMRDLFTRDSECMPMQAPTRLSRSMAWACAPQRAHAPCQPWPSLCSLVLAPCLAGFGLHKSFLYVHSGALATCSRCHPPTLPAATQPAPPHVLFTACTSPKFVRSRKLSLKRWFFSRLRRAMRRDFYSYHGQCKQPQAGREVGDCPSTTSPPSSPPPPPWLPTTPSRCGPSRL